MVFGAFELRAALDLRLHAFGTHEQAASESYLPQDSISAAGIAFFEKMGRASERSGFSGMGPEQVMPDTGHEIGES